MLYQRGRSYMKILKNTIIITFIVSGLLFARTARSVNKADGNNVKIKNQHYWVKGHADEDKGKLDRKRSNKRRRKIRKPVKGLR